MRDNIIYMPNQIYNIDFDTIKKDLKEEFNNVIDYGSLVIFKINDNNVISANNMGKLEYFTISSFEGLLGNVMLIENIFKKYIEDFRFILKFI